MPREVGQACCWRPSKRHQRMAAADPLALGKQQQVLKPAASAAARAATTAAISVGATAASASEADSTTSTLSSVLTAAAALSSGHDAGRGTTVVVPPASPQPPPSAAPAVVSGANPFSGCCLILAARQGAQGRHDQVTVVAPADMPVRYRATAQTDLPRPRARNRCGCVHRRCCSPRAGR